MKNLHLSALRLWQFKNHSQLQIDLEGQRGLAFVGANGQGKTNILDAIHYLCMTKSMFSIKDAEAVQWNKDDGARLEAQWLIDTEKLHSAVVLPKHRRKELWIETKKISASAYLGRFPMVVIGPEHIELIDGSSGLRRKFLNILLAQLDPLYLQSLSKYEKLLAEKNTILKQNPIPTELLDIYHAQIEPLNNYIYSARKRIFPRFSAKLQEYLSLLLPKQSIEYSVRYESKFHDRSFRDCCEQYRFAEFATMHSLFGVHKDDLGFYLGEYLFRSVASQGEKKTLLFALKLTEYALLAEARLVRPLLLLDDIFEKLDTSRLDSMQELLAQMVQTQLFITDVDYRRTEQFLQRVVGNSYKIWRIGYDKLG